MRSPTTPAAWFAHRCPPSATPTRTRRRPPDHLLRDLGVVVGTKAGKQPIRATTTPRWRRKWGAGGAGRGTQGSVLEKVAGHDYALDLVAALVYLGDLGVPHHPLDRIIAGVAVPAQQLDRIRGDLHGRVRGEALRG